jgi:UDP-N-acetylglucosamine--N-acetylmuramyl-(pentapeptide) pyrophosphoryl-undecaprenol N-acetylglucosamine transferase
MKILLTGGGSGGHFYPIIAVAEAINEIAREEKLLQPELYYMADKPYNPRLLYENNLTFKQVPAGKMRRYFSLLNIIDIFKTTFGIFSAIARVFSIYPDVIFGKGGYASFPALVAGRVLRIPVIVHESDTRPGKVNAWASKFATKIAISYPESADFFPKKSKDRIAYTGNPVRKDLLKPLHSGAHEFLSLNDELPVVLVLGGSQGSKRINEALMDCLPRLLEKFQVIHQTGRANYQEIKGLSNVVLATSKYKERYKLFDYLDSLAMRMAAGAATVIVSRAGSNSIFEIAAWKVPSIIIPIPEEISHDQKTNAFAYARSGAATVIEEKNLSASILYSEIERLIEDPKRREEMSKSAEGFAKYDAAKKIARELLRIALKHEI